MAGLWQRTGTATVTNGSKTVTGLGTKWKTGTLPIQKGHTFYGPDNWAYEVDTVVSDTEILLVENYRGGTLANQAYRIDITRTSTISQFAADLASLVGKYRSWFDGMMAWLTGSGDVAILNPDTGANVTIPSWKKVASEGEGQAARAKTEADKAAASAALAGDIVVASALPLPDVWAPLSDSLRMITGYGRDVLVGSDVVARMVNFSRSTTATYIGKDGLLKTAAANEPRFEKEGLLIEGQSTNLRSQPLHLGSVAGATGESLSDTLGAINAAKYTITADAGLRLTFICQPALSTSLTFSIKIHQSSSVRSGSLLVRDHTAGANLDIVNFNLDTDSDSATCKKLGQWNCYTVTTTRFTSGSVPWVYFGAAGANLTGQTVGKFLVIGDCQVEPLPFASSYIPTNGAAVTRAADVCSVQLAGNFVVPVTIGCNYNLLSANWSGLAPAQLLGFKASDKVYDGLRVNRSSPQLKLQSLNEFDGGWSPGVTCQLFGTAVFRAANGVRNEFSSGAFGVPTQGDWKGQTLGNTLFIGRTEAIDNARYLFGHIRNLRIWHRALTDNQIKAVA